ncbi:unnamed protein product [Absidia cylindrospora]
MYSYFALWPLLNLVVNQIQEENCAFYPGETRLVASEKMYYKADGTACMVNSGLEFLVLEVSGPLGNIDGARNAYDHVKGAFALYSMIKAILSRYPKADPSLLNQVHVLFLHAGSSSNIFCLLPVYRRVYSRLWQMTPTTTDKLLLFERLNKGGISLDRTDIGAMSELMQFFWGVKYYSEQAIPSINALKASHAARCMSSEYQILPPLVKQLRPEPLKPMKTGSITNMSTLNPPSSIL